MPKSTMHESARKKKKDKKKHPPSPRFATKDEARQDRRDRREQAKIAQMEREEEKKRKREDRYRKREQSRTLNDITEAELVAAANELLASAGLEENMPTRQDFFRTASEGENPGRPTHHSTLRGADLGDDNIEEIERSQDEWDDREIIEVNGHRFRRGESLRFLQIRCNVLGIPLDVESDMVNTVNFMLDAIEKEQRARDHYEELLKQQPNVDQNVLDNNRPSFPRVLPSEVEAAQAVDYERKLEATKKEESDDEFFTPRGQGTRMDTLMRTNAGQDTKRENLNPPTYPEWMRQSFNQSGSRENTRRPPLEPEIRVLNVSEVNLSRDSVPGVRQTTTGTRNTGGVGKPTDNRNSGEQGSANPSKTNSNNQNRNQAGPGAGAGGGGGGKDNGGGGRDGPEDKNDWGDDELYDEDPSTEEEEDTPARTKRKNLDDHPGTRLLEGFKLTYEEARRLREEVNLPILTEDLDMVDPSADINEYLDVNYRPPDGWSSYFRRLKKRLASIVRVGMDNFRDGKTLYLRTVQCMREGIDHRQAEAVLRAAQGLDDTSDLDIPQINVNSVQKKNQETNTSRPLLRESSKTKRFPGLTGAPGAPGPGPSDSSSSSSEESDGPPLIDENKKVKKAKEAVIEDLETSQTKLVRENKDLTQRNANLKKVVEHYQVLMGSIGVKAGDNLGPLPLSPELHQAISGARDKGQQEPDNVLPELDHSQLLNDLSKLAWAIKNQNGNRAQKQQAQEILAAMDVRELCHEVQNKVFQPIRDMEPNVRQVVQSQGIHDLTVDSPAFMSLTPIAPESTNTYHYMTNPYQKRWHFYVASQAPFVGDPEKDTLHIVDILETHADVSDGCLLSLRAQFGLLLRVLGDSPRGVVEQAQIGNRTMQSVYEELMNNYYPRSDHRQALYLLENITKVYPQEPLRLILSLIKQSAVASLQSDESLRVVEQMAAAQTIQFTERFLKAWYRRERVETVWRSYRKSSRTYKANHTWAEVASWAEVNFLHTLIEREFEDTVPEKQEIFVRKDIVRYGATRHGGMAAYYLKANPEDSDKPRVSAWIPQEDTRKHLLKTHLTKRFYDKKKAKQVSAVSAASGSGGHENQGQVAAVQEDVGEESGWDDDQDPGVDSDQPEDLEETPETEEHEADGVKTMSNIKFDLASYMSAKDAHAAAVAEANKHGLLKKNQEKGCFFCGATNMADHGNKPLFYRECPYYGQSGAEPNWGAEPLPCCGGLHSWQKICSRTNKPCGDPPKFQPQGAKKQIMKRPTDDKRQAPAFPQRR